MTGGNEVNVKEPIRRDIEIRLRATDDTAAGVASANRRLAGVGVGDQSDQIRLAPIRSLPGYSPRERAIRDAQAAELRAIRVQTLRAEREAETAAIRAEARSRLGLGLESDAMIAARRGAAVRSGAGLGGRALAMGNRLLGARSLGQGGALAAIAAAERVSELANNVLDNRAERARQGTSLLDDVKAEAQGLSPLPAIGRIMRDLPEALVGERFADQTPIRTLQNGISRLTGSMTIAEERAARAEEAATKARLDAAGAEIDMATERRKQAEQGLRDAVRRRLSARMGAEFDTAAAVRDFDGARAGKSLSPEERAARADLVEQARQARETGVAENLLREQERDRGVQDYYKDQERQRRERVAEVEARQAAADEYFREMSDRQYEQDWRAGVSTFMDRRTRAVDLAGEALMNTSRARAELVGSMATIPANDLSGDVGGLVGIQSTGQADNNRILNDMADIAKEQLRVYEAMREDLRALREWVQNIEKR